MAIIKKPKLVIPKKQGEWPDLLHTLQEKRLALQKEAAEIEAQEKELKAHIIETLPKSSATGIVGKEYQVKVISKDVPQVDTENGGWDQVYEYIKKHKAWDLLQKRLNDTAVRARWDEGKTVPGVKVFKATTISLTKV